MRCTLRLSFAGFCDVTPGQRQATQLCKLISSLHIHGPAWTPARSLVRAQSSLSAHNVCCPCLQVDSLQAQLQELQETISSERQSFSTERQSFTAELAAQSQLQEQLQQQRASTEKVLEERAALLDKANGLEAEIMGLREASGQAQAAAGVPQARFET